MLFSVDRRYFIGRAPEKKGGTTEGQAVSFVLQPRPYGHKKAQTGWALRGFHHRVGNSR